MRVFSQRAGGGDVEVTATPEQDVVALHLTNGPTLYLHAESARDLFLAQTPDGAARGAAEADSGKIRIPAQLAWSHLEQAGATRGATRGLIGDALLKLVEVIREPAAQLAAEEVVKRVDDQVAEGLYPLNADRLDALKGAKPVDAIPDAGETGPILVFIHGTFSTTSGTFDKLWAQHPERVRQLFDHYEGRVYALDHRTLGQSPIENALTLAKALPRKSPIHLVTHSRGGLVAEVLARACRTEPLEPEDLEPIFKGDEYKGQRDDLAELVRQAQGVQVTRVVRVACPARGTLLASKRLDAYLSVIKWTLELARIPVAPQLVEFLAAVAQRRTDPATIPGLAAQIPDSPLVQWLHSPTERIAGELRVVAGDIAGDSVVSWLKTLLSDSFFRTDNDLVVQTSSMYGGTPRANGASFLFDQGGKVSHFSYFANELTARAVVEGLTNDVPAGFRTIGPLSWAGESATGERAPSTGPDPSKPAVFVLPGILGSNLKQGKDRIWLAFRIVFGLTRLAYKAGGGDGIEPDGPVGRIYDDLVSYLSASHEVIEFPFDWRRPIEEEGRRLATEVEQKLKDRAQRGSRSGSSPTRWAGWSRAPCSSSVRRSGNACSPWTARACSCSARRTAAPGRRCRCSRATTRSATCWSASVRRLSRATRAPSWLPCPASSRCRRRSPTRRSAWISARNGSSSPRPTQNWCGSSRGGATPRTWWSRRSGGAFPRRKCSTGRWPCARASTSRGTPPSWYRRRRRCCSWSARRISRRTATSSRKRKASSTSMPSRRATAG